jgi:hypothetical protein
MKLNYLLSLLIFAFFLPMTSIAQVQFQSSFDYSGNFTKLEKESYKFYLMDVTAEQCRIYNPDYSLWKTVQLNIPNNRWLTDVQFLSQNLFDTDDGVELLYVYYQYVQTSTSYYYVYTTCIVDESGAILLEVPGGSWSEIMNIEGDGSRLMVYVYDYSVYPYPVQTRVYRLPGQITGVAEAEARSGNLSEPSVFPNPSTGIFTVRLPETLSSDKAWTIVLDSGGKLILRQPIINPNEQIDLKSMGFPAGIYYLRLETSKLQTKLQKVVLTE